MTISRTGAHHIALLRKSVKVLVGAMNVSIRRWASDSGAGCCGSWGGTIAAAAIAAPVHTKITRIVIWFGERKQRELDCRGASQSRESSASGRSEEHTSELQSLRHLV